MNVMTLTEKAANYIWLHAWKYKAVERGHRRLVKALRGKTPVKVVFMAVDVALWRYQHLYELMAADGRFSPCIVLTPCLGRQRAEQDMERLRKYFDGKGISYIDYDFSRPPYDVKTKLAPDVLFFPQPYEHLLCREHDSMNFYDRLVCYSPYYFSVGTEWAYNFHFTNQAWRIYYPLPLHLEIAQKKAANHGRNVRVTGYTNADDFMAEHHHDVWKRLDDGKQRKRLIWAPHFSIVSDKRIKLPPRSNFLWMAEQMIDIARSYSDRLQIAFKPHPSLLTQLYNHEEWGKERTDAYYHEWKTMATTQLETGAFIDLFMTSDAMIHDSGSFVVEYHYSQKPVMFVSRDMHSIMNDINPVGRDAYATHYIGSTQDDVRSFIDDVVLGNEDTMRPQREQFFKKYLLPPGGKSVAQNILDDIVESLGL